MRFLENKAVRNIVHITYLWHFQGMQVKFCEPPNKIIGCHHSLKESINSPFLQKGARLLELLQALGHLMENNNGKTSDHDALQLLGILKVQDMFFFLATDMLIFFYRSSRVLTLAVKWFPIILKSWSGSSTSFVCWTSWSRATRKAKWLTWFSVYCNNVPGSTKSRCMMDG